MSGQIPEESKMEQWCLWFVRFVKASLGQDAPSIKEVNFSDNKLSTKGIKRLLATLKELKATVNVIKLFKNEHVNLF